MEDIPIKFYATLELFGNLLKIINFSLKELEIS